MRRFCSVTILIATLFLPSAGSAQAVTPSRERVDTLIRLPQPTPLAILLGTKTARICLDCNGLRQIRPGTEPAFIIKDSASHILAMIPPGDSSYPAPIFAALEPGMIAAVEVPRDTSLVRVLGRGFENGLIIVTLTPAGTVTWRAAAARKATPP
jgi:hypothetical protein